MNWQRGGGLTLEEQTGYRILHVLRFPLAALFIVLLSVTSVVISLTGPSEPFSIDPASSQDNLLEVSQPSIDDAKNSSGDDLGGTIEESQPDSPSFSSEEISAVLTQKKSGENKKSEQIIASSSFVPNYVPQGEEAKLALSFTPIQIASPPSSPPALTPPSPSAPSPPEPTPDEQTGPVVLETFIPNVERWRDDVVAAIAAYGGPANEIDLFLTIMHRESRGQPDATNPSSGAAGLMQHMPQYWDQRAISAGYPGASPYDPIANINVSAWLLYQAAGGGWGHWSTY